MNINMPLLLRYLSMRKPGGMPEDQSQQELLQDVLSAFAFFEEWDKKLSASAAANRPLQELADIVAEVLPEPILIFAMDGRLLASAHTEPIASDRIIGEIFSLGRMPAVAYAHTFTVQSGEVFHDLSDEPRVTTMQGGEYPHAASFYINADNEKVGYVLIILTGQAPQEYSLSIAKHISNHLGKALEFNGGYPELQTNFVTFTAALNGEPISEQAYAKFRSSVGLNGNLAILLIDNLSVSNHTQRFSLAEDINRKGISCFAAEWNDVVALITNADNIAAAISALEGSIRLSTAAIGVSMSVSDISELPAALKQARFALQIHAGPGVRYCRDFAPDYLIARLSEIKMAKTLEHPAISALSHYDQLHSTELLTTLRVLCECGMNQTLAAEKLFIHRNTLKYRLAQMKKLCQLPEDTDGKDLLYLMLSLAIHDELKK